jgi:hypothetical protein
MDRGRYHQLRPGHHYSGRLEKRFQADEEVQAVLMAVPLRRARKMVLSRAAARPHLGHGGINHLSARPRQPICNDAAVAALWSSPGAALGFMTRPHLVAGAPCDGGERDAPTCIHRIAVLTGDRIVLVTTHSLHAPHHLIRVAHAARLRYAVTSQGCFTC